MNIKCTMLACACGLSLIVGCARNDDAGTSGGASTRPSAMKSGASTQPSDLAGAAATEPTASKLLIDNTFESFPPARLRLSNWHGRIVARLYSDNPPEDLTGKGAGNSYDLEMVLPQEIADYSEIGEATWVNHSYSMERQDTPFGIVLKDQQAVLQPMDVTVKFKGQAPRVRLEVSGTFAKFALMGGDSANSAATTVRVYGGLEAKVAEAK